MHGVRGSHTENELVVITWLLNRDLQWAILVLHDLANMVWMNGHFG